MLQIDPLKRATIEDIKKHEWFQKDCPAYLFPSPVEQDSSVIDIDAVREVSIIRVRLISVFFHAKCGG